MLGSYVVIFSQNKSVFAQMLSLFVMVCQATLLHATLHEFYFVSIKQFVTITRHQLFVVAYIARNVNWVRKKLAFLTQYRIKEHL
jgi:ABC-type transport system involved in cytochrome bd biosynthesis fused ATPase/permease subunit